MACVLRRGYAGARLASAQRADTAGAEMQWTGAGRVGVAQWTCLHSPSSGRVVVEMALQYGDGAGASVTETLSLGSRRPGLGMRGQDRRLPRAALQCPARHGQLQIKPTIISLPMDVDATDRVRVYLGESDY